MLIIEQNIDFGAALKHLKAGRVACRAGWNGKGMYLYLERGLEHTGDGRVFEDVIVMFTAQGKHQPGWLASQADMLAEDWMALQE